jgi:hypothetical protein
MSKVKVPAFFTKLDKKEKVEIMEQYKVWKESFMAQYIKEFLQDKLDQLIKEDEEDTPTTEFQHNWDRSKRLGKREVYRKLPKELN